MVQYLNDNRNLSTNRKEHSFRFSERLFTFTTDNGVFSKTDIDYGTRVLLETVCETPLSGDVLDLGCGYGPVSVVIKSLFNDVNITAVDVNPRAVELTELNLKQNHVDGQVLVSDGFSQLKKSLFTTVLTNPPIRAGKQVIYKMFSDSYEHLINQGSLYIVIRKQQGAPSAIKYLETIFQEVKILNKDRGYWVVQCRKLTD